MISFCRFEWKFSRSMYLYLLTEVPTWMEKFDCLSTLFLFVSGKFKTAFWNFVQRNNCVGESVYFFNLMNNVATVFLQILCNYIIDCISIHKPAITACTPI